MFSRVYARDKRELWEMFRRNYSRPIHWPIGSCCFDVSPQTRLTTPRENKTDTILFVTSIHISLLLIERGVRFNICIVVFHSTQTFPYNGTMINDIMTVSSIISETIPFAEQEFLYILLTHACTYLHWAIAHIY